MATSRLLALPNEVLFDVIVKKVIKADWEDNGKSTRALVLSCTEMASALVGTAERFARTLFELYGPNMALDIAAEFGKLDVTQVLCAEFGSNADKSSALLTAAENGHLDVTTLLSQRFGIADRNAVAWAARNGHLDVVRALTSGVERAPARQRDSHNVSLAVALAAENGHATVVQFLCDRCDVVDKDCFVATSYAAQANQEHIIPYFYGRRDLRASMLDRAVSNGKKSRTESAERAR